MTSTALVDVSLVLNWHKTSSPWLAPIELVAALVASAAEVTEHHDEKEFRRKMACALRQGGALPPSPDTTGHRFSNPIIIKQHEGPRNLTQTDRKLNI